MDTLEAISVIERAGGSLAIEGEYIRYHVPRPWPPAVDEALAVLRAHRDAARAILAGAIPPLEAWPESLCDLQRERAAIMEFDGGLSRPEADRRAAEEIWNSYRRFVAEAA